MLQKRIGSLSMEFSAAAVISPEEDRITTEHFLVFAEKTGMPGVCYFRNWLPFLLKYPVFREHSNFRRDFRLCGGFSSALDSSFFSAQSVDQSDHAEDDERDDQKIDYLLYESSVIDGDRVGSQDHSGQCDAEVGEIDAADKVTDDRVKRCVPSEVTIAVKAEPDDDADRHASTTLPPGNKFLEIRQ